MFFIARRIVKYFAVKGYCRKLAPLLARRYGRSKHYTPGQVRRTVEEGGLNLAYICYAYALFVSQAAFDSVHQEMGESCNYNTMLSEIAHTHFGGQENFHDSFIESTFESCSSDYSSGGDSDSHDNF